MIGGHGTRNCAAGWSPEPVARRGRDVGTELSRSLVALRAAAKLTQVDVVARTGVSQARLSRIEQGKSLPTETDIAQLVELYGLQSAQARGLAQAAKDARAGIRDSRLVVQRGNTLAMQQRWRRIEGQARVVRSYHPALVLGVLQIPAYASTVLELPADSEVVRDRALRHLRLLDEAERQHILIQTEGAARLCVGSSEIMADQMAALIRASERPNVQLGIIPADRPIKVVAGTGFHIHDDAAVVVGLEVAAATLTDEADVRHFRGLFDRLVSAAVFGDKAREVLATIADDYQQDQ